MGVLIERELIALLLTLDEVTGRVGDRIRADELDEEDELPAIVVQVPQEEIFNDLLDAGGLVVAEVDVTAFSKRRSEAREIATAIATNGTDPPTGLQGFSGMAGATAIQSIGLVSRKSDAVHLGDDADTTWRWVTSRFRVWFNE